MRAVLLLVMLALAGCGEPKVAYPDDFLLERDDAPEGLLLLQPGMPGWGDYVDATGATENPGAIRPELLADTLQVPEPEDAHAAVYVTIQEAVLVSAAVDLGGSNEAKDWIRNEALDRCLGGFRIFIDGDRLAILYGFGIEPEDLDAAARAVAKSSQADDLCLRAYGQALEGATALQPGSNGPFDAGWFTFKLAEGRDLDLMLSGDDLDVGLFDVDMQPIYERTLDSHNIAVREAGVYGLRVQGTDFTISMEG
ncbi:MAG: hypothetical protein ACPHID_05680 [Thermoplasmatota archaeon]